MARRRWLNGVLIGIAVIGIISGFLIYHWQSDKTMSERMRANTSSLDLGIVYLPITSKMADYYSLKVDYGAMVTKVVKGSLVDLAGIKVGDVILSLNGVAVGEATPLLGMMRSCPIEDGITFGIWDEGNSREITIIQPKQ